MEILFYRAKQNRGWRLDKIIAAWTHGPFSHVELRFSDGMCFSSSFRDKGVRFKNIDIKPERWEILQLNIRDEQEQLLREWASKHIGKKYDFLGIFGFVIGTRIQNKKKWYCSEVCAATLKSCMPVYGYISHKVSPNKLAKLLGVEY